MDFTVATIHFVLFCNELRIDIFSTFYLVRSLEIREC